MSMNKYTEAEHALNPNNDGTDVSSLTSDYSYSTMPDQCRKLTLSCSALLAGTAAVLEREQAPTLQTYVQPLVCFS